MAFIDIDIFKQIINREAPADIIYEDDDYIVIRDIAPKAKVHLLAIPKKDGLITAKDIDLERLEVFGGLIWAAKQAAELEGIGEGYKLHMNVGEASGQIVPRVHLHILSPDFECQI